MVRTQRNLHDRVATCSIEPTPGPRHMQHVTVAEALILPRAKGSGNLLHVRHRCHLAHCAISFKTLGESQAIPPVRERARNRSHKV